MLVQLSKWETYHTSIRVSLCSRRRKRDTENAEETGSCPFFATSRITTASKRSLSRMKVKSSELADCLPFLTITSNHNITVMGKNLIEAEGSSSYREFSNLRYTSRPGNAGSFFPKQIDEKHSTETLPCIPAILDAKNDRVYALQQGNNRLTCWNAWKSNGPDEKSALKIYLEYPALSMTLLPMSKGIIYGSCENGVIYIARVVGETFSVEYLQTKQPKGTVHIRTFAEIEVQQVKTSSLKRKMSDADGNTSVNFYQVFSEELSIKIVKNNISLSLLNSDKMVKSGSLIQSRASIGLRNGESDYCQHRSLSRAELLISSSGSAPKISLIYTITNNAPGVNQKEVLSDTACGTFCALISLVNGEISNSPVKLPSQTNRFGLISETVVAAASSNTIYLYDLITGSILQSSPLQRLIRDIDERKNWTLYTDDKHGILGIFFQKEDHLHVALSAAIFGESKVTLTSKKLKSSAKLACSLLASPNGRKGNFKELDIASSKYASKDMDISSVLSRFDGAVTRALRTLKEVRQMITNKSGDSCPETSFREAFDACLSTLIKDINSFNQENESFESTESNPQDSTNGDLRKLTKKPKLGKPIGRFHPGSSTNAKCRKIPVYIPQPFIDGSVKIVLSIILGREETNCSSKSSKLGLDARHVLKDLIQSKRVSARLHFEGSYALLETEREHPLSIALKSMEYPSNENPLSALQMILEMIVNCSDLSERHLVIMLDYIIRHAKADDIVKTVRYQHTEISLKKQELVKGHEKKTIVAGLKAVLQMIVGYSECNEAMLRVALVEELSSSAEAIILARMLPNLLMISPYDRNAHQFVKSTCQWIAALSEGFRDHLSWAKSSSGQNCLALLLKSIENVKKNSQAVISLKDSIGVAEMVNKHKIILTRKGLGEVPQMEDMWGYSIDHVVF